MSSSISQELRKLYVRAMEDLSKGKLTIEEAESLETCSDRFLKVSKRLYDIYRLFDEEFAVSLDVIAAKSMLHFTRACFTVTHVLRQNNWLDLKESETMAHKFKTLPRRAAHKVWKRVFQRKDFQFVFDSKDYEAMGIRQVVLEQSGSSIINKSKSKLGAPKMKRNYNDELNNTAIAVKDLASNLVMLAKASGLISLKELEKFKLKSFKVDKYSLEHARRDLEISHNILQDYYEVVLLEMENLEEAEEKSTAKTQSQTEHENSTQHSSQNASIGSDECLVPLLRKYKMKERTLLRGFVNYKLSQFPSFCDVNNTTDDLYENCKLISLLDGNKDTTSLLV